MRYKVWTDEDNAYLEQHWQTQSRRAMAQVLDRTLDSVRAQCRKLGYSYVVSEKPTKPSRLELKQQRIAQEEQAILDYLTQHGEARKGDLDKEFGFENMSKRLRLLKVAGKIKHEQRGLYQYWSLGQQVFHKKPFVRTPHQPAVTDLHALPEHIRRWFGLIDFTPPPGRVIEERMPDIPLRQARYTIGSGTQYQIGELASL